MPPRRYAEPQLYQIKVTLKRIRPPIWRRLQVLGNTRLDRLHAILQAAMGWTNSHLHQFVVGGIEYGRPDPTFPNDTVPEQRATLAMIAPVAGSKFRYDYDFGDGWEHDVVVEQLLPVEPGVVAPRCLTGRRACPPEDCGGPWGYGELLAVLADPEHEEHAAMREWLIGDFDPERFSLDHINARLQSVRG